jgi:hypothetical protein
MKKLRISEIYRDARRILMAVDNVAVHHGNSGLGCWLQGSIEPIVIIVVDQEQIFAYNTEAKPISIEQLNKDIPELAAMLSALQAKIKSSGT